jgi:type VI protein secretion system component VasF
VEQAHRRIDKLEDELSGIRQTLMDIVERLSRLEAKVEDLGREMSELKAEMRRRNGMMKWMVVMLGMILSFVAALFGLGWRPPVG